MARGAGYQGPDKRERSRPAGERRSGLGENEGDDELDELARRLEPFGLRERAAVLLFSPSRQTKDALDDALNREAPTGLIAPVASGFLIDSIGHRSTLAAIFLLLTATPHVPNSPSASGWSVSRPYRVGMS